MTATRTLAGLTVVALLVVAACATPGSSPSADPNALRVVATTTVLADFVARVGGDRVVVTSVVPPGGEVHTFDPSPQAIVELTRADVIVANGLGLDEWLADLATDAGATAPIVELAEDLDGVEYIESGADDHDEDDDHGPFNPHLWLDVSNARAYIARIAGVLAEAAPDGASDYRANAGAYDAELAALDAWAREQLEAVPPANRRIVSFHEAFPYLAHAYGLEIVGVVVDAPGQDPSAGEIAALVEAIRDAEVKAVFGEAQFSDALVRTIADETGTRVETRLYNDSLGDPPADSYLGMMRWNVERIVEALR